MIKKLYVRNLSLSATKQNLLAAFERHGPVKSVQMGVNCRIAPDRRFAFVEMPDEKAAIRAISALHGSKFEGLTMLVTRSPIYWCRGH